MKVTKPITAAQLRMLRDFLLVRVDPYLPDTDTEREVARSAVVVAVGKKVKSIKVGQRVLWSHYAGMDVQFADDAAAYRVIIEQDLMAVVTS